MRQTYLLFVEGKGECVENNSRKGKTLERFGVLLRLTNPRARLSRSETKGTIFSCLGELFWILSGSDRLDHIQYYLKRYDEFSDDGITVSGAYGPRLFDGRKKSTQIKKLVDFLRVQPGSRRAVVQIYSEADFELDGKDVPCTLTLQFAIRNGLLDMITFMRSNDIFKGLPHDIFCFTMLQEMIAAQLGIGLGMYTHTVGSLHMYDTDSEKVQEFLDEGFQGTLKPMPEMPKETVLMDIQKALASERSIREGGVTLEDDLSPYWKDLMKLMLAFQISKIAPDQEKLANIKKSLVFNGYGIYIEKLLSRAVAVKN